MRIGPLARDSRRQQVLASQICQELMVHMQIEEEIFYPAYVRATGDQDNLKDGIQEHQEARELIRKIQDDRENARLMLELEESLEIQVDVEDFDREHLESIGTLATYVAGHTLD